MNNLRYVLITPARNEEAFLEQTILSVIGQTRLPEKWAIVSDGSTDRTDEIIRDYASRHAWIRYLRRPEHADRQFAAKAQAFAAGHAAVNPIPHDVVGNLDADLSFESDTMEFLLAQFGERSPPGRRGSPLRRKSERSLRLPVHEHRARVGRLSTLPPGVL